MSFNFVILNISNKKLKLKYYLKRKESFFLKHTKKKIEIFFLLNREKSKLFSWIKINQLVVNFEK